jgi:hypothetical protein
MDHLERAKKSAAFVAEHADVPALTRPSSQIGIMHALIDIAESLRTQRPPQPDPTVKTFNFNGETVRVLIPSEYLVDLPLEAVGGYDNDNGQICSDCASQPKCCLVIHAEESDEDHG